MQSPNTVLKDFFIIRALSLIFRSLSKSSFTYSYENILPCLRLKARAHPKAFARFSHIKIAIFDFEPKSEKNFRQPIFILKQSKRSFSYENGPINKGIAIFIFSCSLIVTCLLPQCLLVSCFFELFYDRCIKDAVNLVFASYNARANGVIRYYFLE